MRSRREWRHGHVYAGTSRIHTCIRTVSGMAADQRWNTALTASDRHQPPLHRELGVCFTGHVLPCNYSALRESSLSWHGGSSRAKEGQSRHPDDTGIMEHRPHRTQAVADATESCRRSRCRQDTSSSAQASCSTQSGGIYRQEVAPTRWCRHEHALDVLRDRLGCAASTSSCCLGLRGPARNMPLRSNQCMHVTLRLQRCLPAVQHTSLGLCNTRQADRHTTAGRAPIGENAGNPSDQSRLISKSLRPATLLTRLDDAV